MFAQYPTKRSASLAIRYVGGVGIPVQLQFSSSQRKEEAFSTQL